MDRRHTPHGYSMMDRWGWLALYMTVGAGIFVSIITIGPWYETRHRPVVIDFQVLTINRKAERVMVRGTMDKVRDCRFVELVVYARPIGASFWTPVHVDFAPANDGVMSRLPLPQSWGPWSLTMHLDFPAEVTMAARHECHNMYLTTTQLTTFEVM